MGSDATPRDTPPGCCERLRTLFACFTAQRKLIEDVKSSPPKLIEGVKPVQPKLLIEDPKPVPKQQEVPTAQVVPAFGGPSNKATTNGFTIHQPGLQGNISKASPSPPRRNSNAIAEILGDTSVLDALKEPIPQALASPPRDSKPGHSNEAYGSSIEQDLPDSMSSTYFSVNEVPEQPRRCISWVIGLDFGTTYSGIAYARMEDDPDIYVYYKWPRKANEAPYCKTLTGLYYKQVEPEQLECASWGYPARSEYMDHRGSHQGLYLTNFKLLLNKDPGDDSALMGDMSPPLTTNNVITDYLKCIGGLALSVLQIHEGEKNFRRDSVQWCVTVPSIWDENAKQHMRECMVNAGLVSPEAGGVDAVIVALEPEAASFHCHQILLKERLGVSLKAKDKVLVVDVGGGTVDIVVQELIASGHEYKVKELTESSGGLCGGTFVDERFMKFLAKKVGCLDEFLRKDCPSYKARLLKDWEEIKSSFGHELMSDSIAMNINLNHKLAAKWEAYEEGRGNRVDDSSVVELTEQDLKSIFDPVVAEILDLIAAQLTQVSGIKVMFVVGGFAGSPYLMRRIQARFYGEVTHIVTPPNPGSAIVQGAVSLALHPDAIVSRIAKKA